MIIGLDFDNTIVDYSNVLSEIAYKLGYLASPSPLPKENIKSIVFKLPEGEVKWSLLQAEVYSEGIVNAKIMKGFHRFINLCRSYNISVSIVSHKTIYNKYDSKRRNLRKSAMNWMKDNNFFDHNGLGFDNNQIYFEDTPLAKIKRIKQLKCTHFVDDLETILLHPNFPSNVVKVLLCADEYYDNVGLLNVYRNWNEITNHIFCNG